MLVMVSFENSAWTKSESYCSWVRSSVLRGQWWRFCATRGEITDGFQAKSPAQREWWNDPGA